MHVVCDYNKIITSRLIKLLIVFPTSIHENVSGDLYDTFSSENIGNIFMHDILFIVKL